MYVSMPHFYDSDPDLLNNVKGLNPDVNEHEIAIDFEPVSLKLFYIFDKSPMIYMFTMHIRKAKVKWFDDENDEFYFSSLWIF